MIVRINGLDTPHWQEDIRVCVAGGADPGAERTLRLARACGMYEGDLV